MFTLMSILWSNAMNRSFVSFKHERIANFLAALITFDSLMHVTFMHSKTCQCSVASMTFVTLVGSVLFMLAFDVFSTTKVR
eukprot:02376.XXX_365_607_1 [CDS] Oithona nana genome sequencing.